MKVPYDIEFGGLIPARQTVTFQQMPEGRFRASALEALCDTEGLWLAGIFVGQQRQRQDLRFKSMTFDPPLDFCSKEFFITVQVGNENDHDVECWFRLRGHAVIDEERPVRIPNGLGEI